MHRLSLARAAQLVGVPRSTLQRMIGAGTLAAFDGLVELEALRECFPEASLDDGGDLARVDRIRSEAFGRRVRERLLPSQEVLAQRLLAQGQELADLRRCAQGYHALLVETLGALRAPGAAQPACEPLAQALEAGLRRILGAEPASAFDAMAHALGVVSAQVTLRPSGRSFLLEGQDSILQAGLKAGARLAYGCGNGNCGLCKARVVSGETRAIAASDYPLSAQERAQGVVLLCAHTALGDLVVDTLEAGGPDDVPAQELPARVHALVRLAPDTLLLHLQTPRSARLRFLAGQSATIGTAVDGIDVQATWPLASCPCDERNLHFHVARDDPQPLAGLLFAGRLAPGTTLNLRGPAGSFVLSDDETAPLVLFACDTGFAPVRSLVDHALAAEQVESIALHWLACRPDGHYLDNACRAWAAAFEHFAYRPATAADPAGGGRALVAAAGADPAALARAAIYVAGPAAFVAAVDEALAAAGIDPRRIHTLVP